MKYLFLFLLVIPAVHAQQCTGDFNNDGTVDVADLAIFGSWYSGLCGNGVCDSNENILACPADCTDTTPPTITVTHTPSLPGDQDIITIESSATDTNGVSSMTVFVDTTAVQTCTATVGPYASGTHEYYATATDNSQNTGTSITNSFTIGQTGFVSDDFNDGSLDLNIWQWYEPRDGTIVQENGLLKLTKPAGRYTYGEHDVQALRVGQYVDDPLQFDLVVGYTGFITIGEQNLEGLWIEGVLPDDMTTNSFFYVKWFDWGSKAEIMSKLYSTNGNTISGDDFTEEPSSYEIRVVRDDDLFTVYYRLDPNDPWLEQYSFTYPIYVQGIGFHVGSEYSSSTAHTTQVDYVIFN